ncbi:ABC transporter substrate-binding protein [Paramixta manurensis]|uniref:ABC transporter substrate-binding protein n=1 Tax=Paramixta manurensis TaxID=2740817 RepID=A0A6M8UEF6_9GAMM|nr:ABC transporter substrate-binding protein [Erwiniaceae bacterium PD-1]
MALKQRIAMSVAGFALLAAPLLASAVSWPLTVTDRDNRSVTIEKEPQHIILQDGRDILSLALLDRDNPFKRVVAWNNLPKKQDTETWKVLKRAWPDSENILDMGFSDQGNVNLEAVIAKHPDLMIAQLRAKPALVQTGVMASLEKLHIPVIFVDYELHPVQNTVPSITLLGKVLNQEARAKAYTDYYQAHLQAIQDKTAAITPKPVVFIEPIAGVGGLDDACCFTHAHNGWGGLVEAAGGVNIGSQLLAGATGDVSVEKIISLHPDYYVMTGSKRGGKDNAVVPFGYNTDPAQIKAKFNALLARSGVAQIPAVKAGHVAAVYHHFYNNPYNIIGLEALSKTFYPQTFSQLDPTADYHQIIRRFTKLPDDSFNLFYQP